MSDFEFILTLLREFFNQGKIQKSLGIVWDRDISGWEIWLQIEFSAFLSTYHQTDIEWAREHTLLVDRRKEKTRSKMCADFIIRKKGFKKDRYIVLEFKQNPAPKSCFSNMIKDVEKLLRAKSSSLDIRSFWVVGIHLKSEMTKAAIRDCISDKTDMDKDSILTTFIPNTEYAFTIF